jgi:signal transduction histidine kinase
VQTGLTFIGNLELKKIVHKSHQKMRFLTCPQRALTIQNFKPERKTETLNLDSPRPFYESTPVVWWLIMTTFFQSLERRPRPLLVLIGLAVLVLVGVVDYLTGFELSFSVFYLLGIAFATWFVGKGFGFIVSVLSVIVSQAGDFAAGAHYSSLFVPVWNVIILTGFYFIVVWLLANLRVSQKQLELKVQQRTLSLTREIAERERLEKEVLEISEREQRRIGHDLHDGLCQHWAATAMAGQVLNEKLAAKSVPEAADAREIVKLAENGITLTRNLAHGISPAEMETEGLVTALHELAANVSKMFKVRCAFECDSPPVINDTAAATHLYRITQEAVQNAVRHGKPGQVIISLAGRKERVELTIEDDGGGLPEDWQKHRGLGTRLMAHRAAMIGGTFSIEPNPTGGTFVKCTMPLPSQNHEHPVQ